MYMYAVVVVVVVVFVVVVNRYRPFNLYVTLGPNKKFRFSHWPAVSFVLFYLFL